MNLQNLPWWGRLLLFVGMAVVIVYIGYKVYPNFTDTQKKIAGLKEENAQLQAEIQKGRGALKRRAELERQIQLKETELALLRRILPSEPETGDLVKWLKSQADQVNLDLRRFTRGGVTNKEFYREYSYGMQVIGEYHDLGDFFERVSTHDRLVNIKGLTLTANRGPERFSKSIRASFNAITFVYQEDQTP